MSTSAHVGLAWVGFFGTMFLVTDPEFAGVKPFLLFGFGAYAGWVLGQVEGFTLGRRETHEYFRKKKTGSDTD